MATDRVLCEQHRPPYGKIPSTMSMLEAEHLDAVEWIERTSSNRPWDRRMIESALEEFPCLGVIAEWNGVINGFCIFEVLRTRIRIHKLTVDCTVHRFGVGTFILDWLKEFALTGRQSRMNVECSERYLGTHQFLRSQGFTALTVVRDYWPGEDAYLFEYVASHADKPDG